MKRFRNWLNTKLIVSFTIMACLGITTATAAVTGAPKRPNKTDQEQTIIKILKNSKDFKSLGLMGFVQADQPDLGIDSSGNTIAVWSVYDDVNAHYVIRANTWDTMGGWASSTTISASSEASFSPLIAVNSSGDAAVIWIALDPSTSFPTLKGRIYYNGSWDSGPTQLSVADDSVSLYRLKLNDNGDISVIWSSVDLSSSFGIYALTGASVSGGWNVMSGVTKISD